jgi:hypothetical protein
MEKEGEDLEQKKEAIQDEIATQYERSIYSL